MRLTDFWARMESQFGGAYARSVAADFRLPAIGATVDDAIRAGVDAKEIWRAVCDAFELPSAVR
ncbi:MAG TPA: DUF3046 domain-containing protein [Jatrophihabitantaceae bacterium]|nr:DUF3046 domain-containing protein [Jatrophihabitantaceae bacterium]